MKLKYILIFVGVIVLIAVIYFATKKKPQVVSSTGVVVQDDKIALSYGDYVKAYGLDYIQGYDKDSMVGQPKPYCKGGKVFINGYPQGKTC